MKYIFIFFSLITLLGCKDQKKNSPELADIIYEQNSKKLSYLISETQLNELPTRSFTLSNCKTLNDLNNYIHDHETGTFEKEITITLKDKTSNKVLSLNPNDNKSLVFLKLGEEIDYQIQNYHGLFFKFKEIQIHPYVDQNYINEDSIKINFPIEGIGFTIPNLYYFDNEKVDFKNLTLKEKEEFWIESYDELGKSEFNSLILPKKGNENINFIYSYPLPSGDFRNEEFSIKTQ